MENKKIVLFTSNIDGGIIQFANQILDELCELKTEATLFVPDVAAPLVHSKFTSRIVFYKRPPYGVNLLKNIKSIISHVADCAPDCVWFMEPSIFNSLVSIGAGNRFKQVLTLHDVYLHPSNKKGIANKFKEQLYLYLTEKMINNAYKVVLLSEVTQRAFENKYSSQKEKTLIIRLGAHLSNSVIGNRPTEVSGNYRYSLFFGRIDKYKGLESLFKAFQKISCPNFKLIVAGKGQLSREETELINKSKDIIVLNRYISDEEMRWLFENSTGLVLPYIEASQSGIIPIAFKFGKPVIVTNIPGLTQFVVDGENGIVVHTIDELSGALIKINDKNLTQTLGANAQIYYEENLDWKRNLGCFLKEIEGENFGCPSNLDAESL